ncbi:MAG: PIN domain-containing protein [Desulfomonile tiedjei]|nr:PIN domain-containing protein [Desulfomonile tiedjei]
MKREVRYWDSACFLGWLKGEPENEEACRQTLRAAEEGEILLVTSALTLAEVVKLKHATAIPVEDVNKVKAFFKQPYIEVRDVNRYVAEEARQLVWDYPPLKPKDAIHVATAMRHHITILDTFDDELIKLNGRVGNPPLKIGKPDVVYPAQDELFSVEEVNRREILFRKFGPILHDPSIVFRNTIYRKFEPPS